MSSERWTHGIAALTACSALVASLVGACTGPTGPDGAAGPTGSAGVQGNAGPAGPTGPSVTSGAAADGGATIPVGCLSPCHGFNGVVSQFQASAHYATYVANIDTATAEEWTATGSACGNCHAIDALAGRVAGNVGTQAGATVANVTSGELEYRTTSGSTTDATYTGSASVAEVYCTTCHAVTDANDPHKTGAVWTPGSFPLTVSEAAGSTSFIEKSATTSSTTGTSIGALGPANTCVWCHKSRKDVTNYITGPAKLSGYWGPHEGPQADLFSAKGGYEFSGMTYGTSTHQQKLTCIDCHMPSVASNAGVPDHSFNPQLSACQSCHIGATSFDVNGGQSLINAGMFELQAALNTAGYLTRATAAPYVALSGTQLTDGAFDTDQPFTGVTTASTDAAGALYNYILIARGGALGVHNPKYEQQLLFDSYFALTGNPPTSIVRPN